MADIIDRIKFLSIKNDLPFIGIKDAGDHSDQGGFTGAVGPKQTEYLSFFNGKANIIHCFLRSEIFSQVIQFQVMA